MLGQKQSLTAPSSRVSLVTLLSSKLIFFVPLTLIGLVFNNDFIKLWMYKVIGWGLPSIPILIWSILMHQSNPIHEELRSDDVISSMCWISDVGNWIVWLRRGPILFILAFNLLILLHIIKILICSQIRNGQDSNQLIKVRTIQWILSADP